MTREALQRRLQQWRNAMTILAVIGVVACALGAWWLPQRFMVAYLFAFMYWLGLSLGCAAMVMIHCLVGGAWGRGLRRVLEAGAWPALFMVLLFIPLILGTEKLYEWTEPHVQEHLGSKTLYLNIPFFWYRAAGYFVIWILLIFFLIRWSALQDERGPGRLSVRLQRLSALGLVLYFLSMTFAAFDWMMSLDPHWFSSIYGVIVIVGQGLGGLAFSIMCLMCLGIRWTTLDLQRSPLIDLGNLLMAGVVLWAYVSFSQFLIIWSGDLSEEIPWYLHRSQGGWQWVALALALFHFAVPFFCLLMRDIKSNGKWLGAIAGGVLFMHAVDLYWLVMPSVQQGSLALHWLDVLAFVAVGAVWSMLFLVRLPERLLNPASELVVP